MSEFKMFYGGNCECLLKLLQPSFNLDIIIERILISFEKCLYVLPRIFVMLWSFKSTSVKAELLLYGKGLNGSVKSPALGG